VQGCYIVCNTEPEVCRKARETLIVREAGGGALLVLGYAVIARSCISSGKRCGCLHSSKTRASACLSIITA
jgi:hypothetical protein